MKLRKVKLQLSLLIPRQIRDSEVEKENLMLFQLHNYNKTVSIVLLTQELLDTHLPNFDLSEANPCFAARVNIQGAYDRDSYNFSRHPKLPLYAIRVDRLEVLAPSVPIPVQCLAIQQKLEERLALRSNHSESPATVDEIGYESSDSDSSEYYATIDNPNEPSSSAGSSSGIRPHPSTTSAARVLMTSGLVASSPPSLPEARLQDSRDSELSSLSSGDEAVTHVKTSSQHNSNVQTLADSLTIPQQANNESGSSSDRQYYPTNSPKGKRRSTKKGHSPNESVKKAASGATARSKVKPTQTSTTKTRKLRNQAPENKIPLYQEAESSVSTELVITTAAAITTPTTNDDDDVTVITAVAPTDPEDNPSTSRGRGEKIERKRSSSDTESIDNQQEEPRSIVGSNIRRSSRLVNKRIRYTR
ncbi:hypothetical protein A0J61_07093 [Choanephora cucurbitarum]|uniref:Uncharacterized protein n=1 Tax=Choanephora cucurbitarum TaxID=101091 RepID=A0A1C7N734_9FUNG|nr:hypothetical protein A0J61_07093 [Choanephora cucurbitarum]